jgi:two-component system LytT family response regulator
MKIKTLIVDDSKLSRDTLFYTIRESFPLLEVVGESGSVQDAYEQIRSKQPDLLILDVQLPDGSAFDLLDLVGNIKTKVIFISAHEKYAVQAIQSDAFDYLLKPLSANAVRNSLTKAIHFFADNPDLAIPPKNAAQEDQVVGLSTTKGFVFVNELDIIYLKAEGKYTEVVTMTEIYKSSKNLKVFEKLLNPMHFFRVHHSYLIHLHHISRFEKQGNVLTMNHAIDIPVSHRKKEQFVKRLQHLL